MGRLIKAKYLYQAMLIIFLAGPFGAGASESKQGQAVKHELSDSPDGGDNERASFIHARFLGLSKDGKHARYRLEWVSPKTSRSFKGLLEFLDPSGRRLLGIIIPYDSGITFASGKPYIGETAELWTPGDREFLKYVEKNPTKVKMRFSAWHIVFKDRSEFHWPKEVQRGGRP